MAAADIQALLDSQPPALPAYVARVTADGKPTTHLLDWEMFQTQWFKGNIVATDQRITTVKSQTDSALALFDERITAITGDNEAMVQRVTTLEADVGSNTARITAEETARANADSAMASRITTLETSVSNNTARITTEEGVRSDAVSALAGRLTTVEANVGTNAANISDEIIARVAQDGVLAGRITDLSTTVNGHTATLSTYGVSIDGLQVQYGVYGYIDGTSGGFVFSGVKQNNGSVVYTTIFDSNVIINGGLVVNGTLVTDKIADNAISNFGLNATTNDSASLTVTVKARKGDKVVFFLTVLPYLTGGTDKNINVTLSGHSTQQIPVYATVTDVNVNTGVVTTRMNPCTYTLYWTVTTGSTSDATDRTITVPASGNLQYKGFALALSK